MKIIIMILGLFICSVQVLASPSSEVQSDGYNGLQGEAIEPEAVTSRLQTKESVSEQRINDVIAVAKDVSFLAGMGYMVYGATELITGNNPLTSFIVGAGLLSVPTLLSLAVSAKDDQDITGISISNGDTGTNVQPNDGDDD